MLKGSCLVCGKQECRAEHRAAPPMRVMTPTIATQPAPKRLCVQSAVSPTPSTATPSRNQSSATIPICTRVCILGREYSTLKWHLGKKTNDSQLERAANHGFSRAIELSGGDTHTLKSRELVSSSAARPPELLPGRQNLPRLGCSLFAPRLAVEGKISFGCVVPRIPRSFGKCCCRVTSLRKFLKTSLYVSTMFTPMTADLRSSTGDFQS